MVDWCGLELIKILRWYHQPLPKWARNIEEIAASLEMVRKRASPISFGDTTDRSVAFLEHFFRIFSKLLSIGDDASSVISSYYSHSGGQLLTARPQRESGIGDVDACGQDDKECSCPAEESDMVSDQLQQEKRFDVKR
ncbi:hypothetical protein CMUS01_00922 [Colletotrichum musicola]|uniref:Uncharacterized protein n=1 Tax=Colletotrichum musicola TaxID=2175873 RepID=A0A8H6NXV0_9PEZI|nr:hypothetical protein CMUS01_00922 [Colletotrichum musicola]